MVDALRPSDDADHRKAAEIRAELEATVSRAKQAFEHHLEQAHARLRHVEGRLRLWEDRRVQLSGLEDDPRGSFHFVNARLLVRLYQALRRTLEIEVAAHRANLDAVGVDEVPDFLALRSPDDDPAYHESRRRLDHTLAMFLWRVNGEGVDAVLRAADQGEAIDPLDDAEAALRAARALELRAVAAEDPALARLLGQLGAELAETLVLMTWATGALKRYEQLDGAGRRALLGASEWAKLNGKLAMLRQLHARTAPWPALGRWFPAPDPVALPFPDASEWADAAAAAPKGPDKLRVPPASGRASSLRLDRRRP